MTMGASLKGEDNPRAILSEEQVHLIRAYKFISGKTLAKWFGISISQICKIRLRQSCRDVDEHR